MDKKLGLLEERLLGALRKQPLHRWDLIKLLYPQESNTEILENRFKNLMARVRKKLPGILHCEEGIYRLKNL